MLILKIESKKILFIFLFVLIGIAVFGLFNTVEAAVLTQITATPASVAAGATTSYTIAFTTTTAVPADGKITIQFQAGFDVSGASFTSWTGFDGGQSLNVDSQTITITRDGLGTSSTAGAKTIVLGNIVNTSTTGNNYQVTVTTKTADDLTLNSSTGTIYFQIFSSHSETDIDGIYYLRDNSQAHYQHQGGAGASSDIGTLSRTAPTSNEERHCANWVQFYFDENGTYAQTNQIANIYYHIWWETNNNQGTLGYDETGRYDWNTTESFTINTVNSPNKVTNCYLYAGKQAFDSPQSILGNAIYNFEVKFTKALNVPITISSPGQSSFIILNLPDDDSIAEFGIKQDGDTDYDDDGISDYDELFTYYTNPYDTDSDNDGWNDKYEVDNSLNPVDPDQAPTFGKWLLKQYDGTAASDTFSWSISSISDIDGDGRDDVLVGAPYANSYTGSAYIYSSAGSSTVPLKQYDGAATDDAFGWSVSSISDIDEDGKDDVLVSAPNGNSGTGSAYIFSSAGSSTVPLKQYNGEAAGDNFGWSVSSISDIDGDRKNDVLVGAPYANSGAGSAYIYSSTGSSTVPLKQYDGAAVDDTFGLSVSSISDIDEDGKADVLIGAPAANSGAGSAYIFSSTGSSTVPLKQYDGAAGGDSFSYSISSISDIDGDGKADVLIGAPNADPDDLSNAGSAYIYSSTGSSTVPLKQYDGAAAGDNFGLSVFSISDIDGDKKGDVLVGAPYFDANYLFNSGSAYIYSSTGSSTVPLKQYDGAASGDGFGYSVSSISDIDEDGKADLLVGASNADPGDLSIAGSAYLYSSTGHILTQSWSKGSSKTDSFDLDDYFIDPNNSTIPARNQAITYTASTSDNPYIDVTIDGDNQVSFSQPADWSGTETVVFTATDSTGLSSTSNTITLTVTENIAGGSSRKRCFIATAAYGTPMAEEVQLLCRFRDKHLLTNRAGSAFTKFYYRHSPAAAEFISKREPLKKIVRIVLKPLISLCRLLNYKFN